MWGVLCAHRERPGDLDDVCPSVRDDVNRKMDSCMFSSHKQKRDD